MLPDRVSNPGPLTYESGALPIALCGPAYASVDEQILGGEEVFKRLPVYDQIIKTPGSFKSLTYEAKYVHSLTDRFSTSNEICIFINMNTERT